MSPSIESATPILERIAFLDAMSSQLSVVSAKPEVTAAWMFVAYAALMASFLSGLFIARTSRGVCVALSFALLSGGFIFVPSQNNKVAQVARIEAVIQGLPPTEILSQWTGNADLSNEYISNGRAASIIFSLNEKIKKEKSNLEIELARVEFIESGGLEKLKNELLQAALEAKESGTATPEQLALISQTK